MTDQTPQEGGYEKVVLPFQEAAQAEYLANARAKIQALAAGGRIVTSDDIWRVCPPPANIDSRVLGAVFKPSRLWEKVGYRQSDRRVNHKRPIAEWRLRG